MAKRNDRIEGFLVTEEELATVARIIGGFSAAQQALNDIEKRRAAGEDPVCIQTAHKSFIVCDRSAIQEA